MFTSGLKVSIDHHYCGGNLAGTKLSLNGKLASCGMEKDEHVNPAGLSFEKRCCEDLLVFYGIVFNYIPEEFLLLQPTTGNKISMTPVFHSASISIEPGRSDTQVYPPGNHIKPEVELSYICNLRI